MQRSITVKDIAQGADVSIATVSRVLNNHANINAEIRQRVLQVAEELGYEKYGFEYRNPMSNSFFDLFQNNEKDNLDEELDEYNVDMYYMGNNLVIENELTGDGITLSPNDIDRLLDLIDERFVDYEE